MSRLTGNLFLAGSLSQPQTPVDEKDMLNIGRVSNVSIETSPPELHEPPPIYTHASSSTADIQSITTSQYDAMIHDELESKWILNLSMHFRDKSKREKFFVTYRERESMWRRVTISLDYRNAPEDSLEKDLLLTKYQRDKSAKIYEAIRESLQDIQFYETVTNLKLQTTDGRLHVHVVEDVNVRVDGRPLIKKEIPGPDTVEEFLYEVNALNYLGFSKSVIEFYGVVIDDDEHVKGLLISYAEKGALIDLIYDSQEHELDLPWSTREKWAKQIVQGLADIHESGKQAKELLEMFPEPVIDNTPNHVDPSTISVDYGDRLQEYQVADFQHNGHPEIRVVEPQNDWPSYPKDLRMSPGISEEQDYYPSRGRSPPSPSPGNHEPYYSPYTNNDVMWSSNMGAYAGMAEPNLGGTRADTPRETQTATDIAERLVRDLKNIEAGLQDELADELAPATGGESRAVEAAPALETTGVQAPADVLGESREPCPQKIQLHGVEGLHDRRRIIVQS
ncbi:putative protein kinase domain-containing protein [Eutypa lata UCREL1]|uniref:Protein kinase domain-containing protein n=1 Tax=Eutypa lata (strain UCR-EL1) TaxID=1287681 RepID=M7SKW7_EUTLA|nr:putative protein kinase domain-containing protein [Eutypa lata UCREL1]